MNLLFPTFHWRLLPAMLGITALGVLISGSYGIFHDQVTYSISPEYFTKMKFEQFRHADFGFSERVFVGEIGFLATWWVGLVAGWVLARIAIPFWPINTAVKKCVQGFVFMAVTALAFGIGGHLMGVFHSADYSFWNDLCEECGVTDVPAFANVGLIHNASYLGGLVGLIGAIFVMLRSKRLELQLRMLKLDEMTKPVGAVL